ncbi:MAG: hypothetical protein ACTSVD_06800, partial [Candidatus Thorarchaeota archaeon]
MSEVKLEDLPPELQPPLDELEIPERKEEKKQVNQSVNNTSPTAVGETQQVNKPVNLKDQVKRELVDQVKNEIIDEISKETGIPREEVEPVVSEIFEEEDLYDKLGKAFEKVAQVAER